MKIKSTRQSKASPVSKTSNLLPSGTELSMYGLAYIAIIQIPNTFEAKGPIMGIFAVLAVISGISWGITSAKNERPTRRRRRDGKK